MMPRNRRRARFIDAAEARSIVMRTVLSASAREEGIDTRGPNVGYPLGRTSYAAGRSLHRLNCRRDVDRDVKNVSSGFRLERDRRRPTHFGFNSNSGTRLRAAGIYALGGGTWQQTNSPRRPLELSNVLWAHDEDWRRRRNDRRGAPSQAGIREMVEARELLST